jgi:hypothetical protein
MPLRAACVFSWLTSEEVERPNGWFCHLCWMVPLPVRLSPQELLCYVCTAMVLAKLHQLRNCVKPRLY